MLAVAAFVSAVLDERVAQELLVEDMLVFNSEESEVSRVVDHVARLRAFAKVIRRLRDWQQERKAAGLPAGIEISRSSAALLAAAHVAEAFEDGGP